MKAAPKKVAKPAPKGGKAAAHVKASSKKPAPKKPSGKKAVPAKSSPPKKGSGSSAANKATVKKTALGKVFSATKKNVGKKKPVAAKTATKKPLAKVVKSTPNRNKPEKKASKKVAIPSNIKKGKTVKVPASKVSKPLTKPVKSASKVKTSKPEVKKAAPSKAPSKKASSSKVHAPAAVQNHSKTIAPKEAVIATKSEVKSSKPVKTVEQQLQEKQVKPASEKKSKKSAEVEVEDGIIFPSLATHVPMRRRVPVFIEDTSSKPVANPVFVPQAGEMRNVVKFAPVAIIERPKEKNNKTEEEDMSSKTSPRLAFQESDDKKGISVEAKLRALYAIQLFDSRIDKIHAMRGELPLEVQDLEDDVTGLETRVERMSEEHKLFADDITNRKLGIKNAEALIKKYKEQLNNVKNNREFDSLNKEIEFQELEIQLHTKKIKESEGLATIKLETLEANKSKLEERKNDLKVKRKELDDIIASTEKEEKFLRKKSDEAKKKIEERLLAAYERIRSGSPNGMAVVPIEREASAGSFIQLPPQKQLDVASRRRVIVDEHSGRILVDSELAQEEQAAFDAMISSDLV